MRASLPTKPMIRLACGVSLLLCLFLLTTGCGRRKSSVEHVAVTGKVTYNRKPVTGGVIVFISEDGFANNGRIDENGNYSISAPLGNVKITVDNRMLRRQLDPVVKKAIEHKGAGRPDQREAEPIKGKYVEIPAKYWIVETTPLTWTVTKDQPIHDIELN